MITYETLRKVQGELVRYHIAEKALLKRFAAIKGTYQNMQAGCGCIESAALKRASLDLSRALTQLRMNPGRIKRG